MVFHGCARERDMIRQRRLYHLNALFSVQTKIKLECKRRVRALMRETSRVPSCISRCGPCACSPCRKNVRFGPKLPTSKPRTPTLIHPIANPRPEPVTMSLAASRQVLRHSTFAVRRAGLRNASSTSEAAGAAKEKAAEASSKASSKASEGLSRVSSSASAAASKVGSAATDAANKVGGRTGRLIGGVQGECAIPVHRCGRRQR
jgi:hypothetical protein